MAVELHDILRNHEEASAFSQDEENGLRLLTTTLIFFFCDKVEFISKDLLMVHSKLFFGDDDIHIILNKNSFYLLLILVSFFFMFVIVKYYLDIAIASFICLLFKELACVNVVDPMKDINVIALRRILTSSTL